MKCDGCGKEETWLEAIGSNFICHKCINKHKIMGLIMRTHMDTFQFILRKLKIENYEQFMQITRKGIEDIVDLRKHKIFLKTTNIVELE